MCNDTRLRLKWKVKLLSYLNEEFCNYLLSKFIRNPNKPKPDKQLSLAGFGNQGGFLYKNGETPVKYSLV